MYRGRFAPSPTGPLHLGSLLAAVGSWLDARSRHGTWLVRIEDIDPPREIPGAAQQILRSLEAHGLEWDDSIAYQSARMPLYREHLEQLRARGRVYACDCSRSDIAAMGGSYDGRCRHRPSLPEGNHAWRFIIGEPLVWDDLFRGPQHQAPATLFDPVIWRRDGLVAYQLAVAVDDALMQISHVIRGADLLDSTPVQIAILNALERQLPEYGHLPLIRGADGAKLSKQQLARPLDDALAGESLTLVLGWLGRPPPPDLHAAPVGLQLEWARAHWQRDQVPLSDHQCL